MLSDCISNYQDELLADFMQYYHVYDVISQLERGEISPRFAAVLCAQLPHDSRCFVAMDPDNAWSIGDSILVSVDFDLRALMYSLGGGKGKKPKPIHDFKKRRRQEPGTIKHDDGSREQLELVEIPDLAAMALRLTTATDTDTDGGEEENGIG